MLHFHWEAYRRGSILDAPASIDRMRFWMSPAIAPLVRSCTAGSRSAEYINCPTQVDFFLANLHTLTQLRSLSLWEMYINREGFAALHQLPCLDELSVDCCQLDVHPPRDVSVYPPRDFDEESRDENIRVPLLRLSKLSILRSAIAVSSCFYPAWMLVVDPARLRDLTLSCGFKHYDFSTLGASNVRMVERLFVQHDHVHNLATLPPGTLPMLKEFEGPAQLARQFLASSPLERLTLRFDKENALDDILSDTPPARNVLVLKLDIHDVDIARADPVLRLFPNLTELTAWIDLYETTKKAAQSLIWKTVRQMAGMAPTSLVSLSLTLNVRLGRVFRWQEEPDDFESVRSSVEYAAFIAEAHTGFPGLKDVWIDIKAEGPIEDFTVQWRQHPNGRVSQEVAKDEETIERMRRMKGSTRSGKPGELENDRYL
ncbi:hypothetical protein C8F01DRAFT_1262658 [Mycena amicta]|nr:hypothetical protein C8F01DRAFT_1262658 [Mycena amicta]